jgi:hypothetical protein
MLATNGDRSTCPRGWAARLLPLGLSFVALTQAVYGAEDGKPELPAAVEKILHWFPEDTETIVVGQSFKIDAPQRAKERKWWELPWSIIQEYSLGNFILLEENVWLNQLGGRGVAVAINGGRDFEAVSSFGSLRYQGCSVIRFDGPLPDQGRALADALQTSAKEVRRMAGTDVFVFPDRTVMESTYKPKAWQGQFIALPAPDTILCATSDAFLENLLTRMAGPAAANRALPSDLPEWKYVDPAAPAWSLRHIRKKVPGQSVTGLTWCLKPHGRDVFEVTYLRIEGANARPVTNIWNKSYGLLAHPSIEEKADGTTVVSADIKKEKLGLWYPMVLYWSMGETGQSIESKVVAGQLKAMIGGKGSTATPEPTPQPEVFVDGLELVWSTEGVAYSGVAVAADGKTIVAVRENAADTFDVSGRKTQSVSLAARNDFVRWARLTGDERGELLLFEFWTSGLTAVKADGSELWHLGPDEGIDDVCAADLDGDGKDEVIVSYGGNGLHVLGGDGKLRWKNTSVGFHHVSTGDLDGDDVLEVVAATDLGKIQVFDADGRSIATHDPGIDPYKVQTFRLPGESADSLLVFGRDQQQAQMVAIDAKGTRRWKADVPAGVNSCFSLSFARGSKWSAAGSGGSSVWVFDVSTGQIVDARDRQGRPQVAWATGTDGDPLLLVASTSGLRTWRVKPSVAGEPAQPKQD